MEMLIGGFLAAPFSWSRLFMDDAGCMRHVSQLTVNLAEMALHWNELTMVEQGWVIFDIDDRDKAS